MADSFLEKLKKGMGIEIPGQEEESKEKRIEREKTSAPKKEQKKEKKEKQEPEEELSPAVQEKEMTKIESIEEEIEEAPQKAKEKKSTKPKVNKKVILKTNKIGPEEFSEEQKDWLTPEGQLSVDVYQTGNELVIQSAIAGVKASDLDISIEGDMVTIRGKRGKPNEEGGDYFTQECYWGQFSREIILPTEIDPSRAKATMKDGVLIIRMPKILREKKRKILIKKLNE